MEYHKQHGEVRKFPETNVLCIVCFGVFMGIVGNNINIDLHQPHA